MKIKVIGAGFGRTGTDSLREALNILGLGPCHHMMEVMAHPEQLRLWRGLAKGATPDWSQLLDGYRACVDWPSAFYWKELMAAYPEALVVLTYRSPESWWTSFEKTILPRILHAEDKESVGYALINKQVFDGRPQDREHAIEVYEANVNLVKATVPSDRLLVFNLGDGWEPLCAKLGVPVPTQAYPNRNSATEFQARTSNQ